MQVEGLLLAHDLHSQPALELALDIVETLALTAPGKEPCQDMHPRQRCRMIGHSCL